MLNNNKSLEKIVGKEAKEIEKEKKGSLFKKFMNWLLKVQPKKPIIEVTNKPKSPEFKTIPMREFKSSTPSNKMDPKKELKKVYREEYKRTYIEERKKYLIQKAQTDAKKKAQVDSSFGSFIRNIITGGR